MGRVLLKMFDGYIYVDGWKTKIRFSSAHLIPEYKKCGRLHGHTYAVHAKVYGEPDEKGIIVDFSVLKAKLKEIVEELDHKILIPKDSSQVDLREDEESVEINMLDKKYVLPVSDCCILSLESSSAENLSRYILKRVIDSNILPGNVKKLEIGVDEGFGQGARIIKEL